MAENKYERTQTRFRSVIRDRRNYPRVLLRRRGQVLRPDGAPVDVTVHDISPDGLQARCLRDKAMLVHPSARSVVPGDAPVPLSVFVTLPLVPHPAPVRLDGTLLYFALINPNLVALGVLFEELSAASRGFLERYIEQSLEPAEGD